MTRFVVHPTALLRIAADDIAIDPAHELLAPTLVRSQVLSALHEAVHRGDLHEDLARQHLAHIHGLKMRLLGDRVLQKVAWEFADALGWASTLEAEYLALTKLQADAFITLDPELEAAARTLVPTATLDDLR